MERRAGSPSTDKDRAQSPTTNTGGATGYGKLKAGQKGAAVAEYHKVKKNAKG